MLAKSITPQRRPISAQRIHQLEDAVAALVLDREIIAEMMGWPPDGITGDEDGVWLDAPGPDSEVRTEEMYDRWELLELDRRNAHRPPSQRCRRLPLLAYEATCLMGYVE